MALPKGIDIAVLGAKNSFVDYLERSMVISAIQKGLRNAGFEDVGVVYSNTDYRIEVNAIETVFDVAARYLPSMREVPVTIAVQKSGRFHREIDLEADDLVIGRMHREAVKNTSWHLRSHAKPFPL